MKKTILESYQQHSFKHLDSERFIDRVAENMARAYGEWREPDFMIVESDRLFDMVTYDRFYEEKIEDALAKQGYGNVKIKGVGAGCGSPQGSIQRAEDMIRKQGDDEIKRSGYFFLDELCEASLVYKFEKQE